MNDPAPQKSPQTPGEKWFLALFVVAFVVLIGAELAHEFSPAKATAICVLLLWLPLLVTHELGHAVAAHLLNWRVAQLVIGFGPTLKTFTVTSAQVEIRLIPITGFVVPIPKDLRAPAAKHALISFAGPGTDLLFFILAAWVVGWGNLFATPELYGEVFWQSLAVAALAQAVLNLLPYGGSDAGGGFRSDGLQVLTACWARPEYWAELKEWAENNNPRRKNPWTEASPPK